MDRSIVKGKPFSKKETWTLVNLVANSIIITTKATNATNNTLKKEEWVRLTSKFNSTATYPRNPQQLRLKWENLKKNSRKRCTKIRLNQIKTGGGPPDYIPPDEILEKVSSLLGNTCTGFVVPFGGDGELGRQEDGENPSMIENDIVSVVESEDLPQTSQQTPELRREPINKLKTLTFGIPRAVKRKKNNENRESRDLAIADYFRAKKAHLDKYFKLKTEKLQLQIEKLKKKDD